MVGKATMILPNICLNCLFYVFLNFQCIHELMCFLLARVCWIEKHVVTCYVCLFLFVFCLFFVCFLFCFLFVFVLFLFLRERGVNKQLPAHLVHSQLQAVVTFCLLAQNAV